MMTFHFDLTKEPWIPCLVRDGTQTELGLRDTLVHAHEIAALAGDSPPVTASLYRLLLAVAHRCAGPDGETGPGDSSAWEALWRAGRFHPAAIDGYLARWPDRFDLFDPIRPFYQTSAPAVDEAKSVSIAKLLFQSENNPTLFDHSAVDQPPNVSPAQGARLIIAYQAFDTAGLITGAGPEKTTRASPLLQCAVVVVRGKNLFETLMLNLSGYSPVDGVPWDFEAEEDQTAWERDGDTQPEDRLPKGYLDLLTWQSRRIRLWPEERQGGRVTVRRATIMKGFQIPGQWERIGRETMVAFRRRLKPQPGQDPWPPVGFQEDRALWRDSLAFMESFSEASARPKTLSWLSGLAQAGVINRTQMLPVDALGLAANRAKLLFWRHERLTLPLPYLDEDGGARLRAKLSEALKLAEDVGRLMGSGFVEVRIAEKTAYFPSPFRLVAQELLGADGPVEDFVRHLAPGRAYWGALDDPFRTLLESLPNDSNVDSDGRTLYGEATLPKWKARIRVAALEAFAETAGSLERSARTARAVSLAEQELQRRLFTLLGARQAAVATPAITGGNQP